MAFSSAHRTEVLVVTPSLIDDNKIHTIAQVVGNWEARGAGTICMLTSNAIMIR